MHHGGYGDSFFTGIFFQAFSEFLFLYICCFYTALTLLHSYMLYFPMYYLPFLAIDHGPWTPPHTDQLMTDDGKKGSVLPPFHIVTKRRMFISISQAILLSLDLDRTSPPLLPFYITSISPITINPILFLCCVLLLLFTLLLIFSPTQRASTYLFTIHIPIHSPRRESFLSIAYHTHLPPLFSSSCVCIYLLCFVLAQLLDFFRHETN